MGKNDAFYINEDVINKILAAGIDPKTGLPLKAVSGCKSQLKTDIKRQLRVIDEQDAVNRYQWYNLPLDISSQELERLLYYKGQLCMFYFRPLEKFFVMPYALDGTIDFYGRYNTIHPVPMAEGTTDEEKKLFAQQSAILSQVKLKVLYDIPIDPLEDDPANYCILLHDYTKQLSQTTVPRQILQDSLLDIMADCIPFMRTALLNSTGVQGMRVGSTDEQSNVQAANISLEDAALNGKKMIPILGAVDFQELTSGTPARGEEFLMALQSLDNFRLNTYGLENGGLFEKKQYQNNAQTMLNGSGQIGSPLQDGLSIRQRACDIANAIWGAGMSCEISEQAAGMDLNMDGLTGNNNDQSGVQGDQPAQGGTND